MNQIFFNGDISKWNTKKVYDIKGIYFEPIFSGNIWSWDLKLLNNESLKYINKWRDDNIHIYERGV